MQFSTALIAAVAFGFANAVSFTNSAFNGITAGQPIELTWTDASGPVTITLKNGASTDLQTVSVVASGQTGSSFTWSVPSTLTQDTYALEITDSSATPNYSPQFELIGGAPATSSAASSISASASSASSSVASSISSVTSSLSSVASSISSSLSTATASSTTSSDASSTTAATNGTTTTGSSTSTRASSTGSRTSTTSPTTTAVVPNSNSAADIASPLALVFLTFAAILSFN